MNWWKQFKPKGCSVRLKATEKEGLLQELIDNMVVAQLLSEELRESAVKALREREQLGSTGVGQGVAIPHVKLEGIARAVCSLSIHEEGIDWAAVDGAPVRIFFTVLRPPEASPAHDPERHLDMMRWIAKLARESDFRRFATSARTKTELVGLLKEMSTV